MGRKVLSRYGFRFEEKDVFGSYFDEVISSTGWNASRQPIYAFCAGELVPSYVKEVGAFGSMWSATVMSYGHVEKYYLMPSVNIGVNYFGNSLRFNLKSRVE